MNLSLHPLLKKSYKNIKKVTKGVWEYNNLKSDLNYDKKGAVKAW